MYIPKHFDIQDPALLLPLMQRFNFAILVTVTEGAPFATHIPLLVKADGSSHGMLAGHLARANPQWRHFDEGQEVLVIFQGDHAYISPSWYASHPNVPTWNYMVVHAYGIPRIVEDNAAIYRHLDELVQAHESGYERPWVVSQSEDYVRTLMRGVVAFEIAITRLEGKFKLSQNKTPADRTGVIAALAASSHPSDQSMGAAMRASKPYAEE